MTLKFCKWNKDCYLVQDACGENTHKNVGRIDRSPMNPRVWMVDFYDGKTTGHTGLAAAKNAARKAYKAKANTQ